MNIKSTDMKKASLLTACMMLIPFSIMMCQELRSEAVQNEANRITVTASPEIEALVGMWAAGFESSNPGMKVTLTAAEAATAGADIHFIAGNSLQESGYASAFRMVVGRDVVVPVMSDKNPFLEEIFNRGLSQQEFAALLSSEDIYTWGKILGNNSSERVNALILGNSTVQSSVARFVSLDQSLVRGSFISSPSALIGALDRDPLSVGFLRLADITDPSSQEFISGLRVIPVDVNSNGISDYFEQFYSDFRSFNRGVYIGKYPKTLCNNIFAVAPAQQLNEAGTALLSYILTDGQPKLALSGFTALADGEGRNRAAILGSDENVVSVSPGGTDPYRAAMWVAAFIITVSLLSYALYRLAGKRASAGVKPESVHNESFSEKNLIIPAGILFDKSHTWAFMERDGSVRVGIDDFLQHLTGSITRLRMKSPGEKVRKGDHILSLVQKGKQLDICSPVSGIIRSSNEQLVTNPAAINNSPFNDGWIYTIEPDNWMKESRIMIMAGKYAEWIKGEFTRMKDFLASLPDVNQVRLAHVVLQDGGELKEGLLEEFGPEVWEEFQMKFMDNAR